MLIIKSEIDDYNQNILSINFINKNIKVSNYKL